MKAIMKDGYVRPYDELTDWEKKNLDFLTSCDGWVLVENYVEKAQEGDDEYISKEIAAETPAEVPAEEPQEELVTVNGVQMTKEQALALLTKSQ